MRLKRSAIGVLLLVFALIPSRFYFPVIVVISFFLIGRQQYVLPKGALIVISPLLLMGAAGAIYGIPDQSIYVALKDIWYLAKIIFLVILGYLIASLGPIDSRLVRNAVFFSSLAAIPNLYKLIASGAVSLSSFQVSVLGGIMLLPFYLQGALSKSLNFFSFKLLVVLPLLLTVVLSLSRTTILLFIVAWFGARGVFLSKGKIAVSLTAAALLIISFFNMLPEYDINNVTFFGKLSNSVTELLFVTSNNETEITANWRGFEAYKAYTQWQEGSLGQIIFGQGFGTPVDISFYYPLFGDAAPPIRFLPVLHNGYAMILVKYGIFGVLMFLIFVAMPFLHKHNSKDEISILATRLSTTCSISLIVAMPLVTGPFNLAIMDGITLLMGWSIGLQTERLRT